MNKETLRVLLVEDSPEYAELVERWLSLNNRSEFILSWTDSLAAALNRLPEGGVDVILLDLGLPDSNGLETFSAIKAHAPQLPVIVLTGNDDGVLALAMVKAGAQDYIIKSECNADLLSKTIQCAMVRYAGRPSNGAEPPAPNSSKVIGVIGAKGGMGATTLACNLATALRRQTHQKTLLTDLDIDAGLVGFLMNTTSESGILDAADNVKHLDLSWETIMVRAADDLHVVHSPGWLGLGAPDAEKIRAVISFVRTFYPWIVADLGRLTELSRTLLPVIDELLLITTADVPALFGAKRTIGALRTAGFDPRRIRLVVNQVSGEREFSASTLNRIFEVPAYATLPHATEELHLTCTQRTLPAETGAFGSKIASLARKITGLPEAPSKRGLSRFLGLRGKPNAAAAGAAVTPGVAI